MSENGETWTFEQQSRNKKENKKGLFVFFLPFQINMRLHPPLYLNLFPHYFSFFHISLNPPSSLLSDVAVYFHSLEWHINIDITKQGSDAGYLRGWNITLSSEETTEVKEIDGRFDKLVNKIG